MGYSITRRHFLQFAALGYGSLLFQPACTSPKKAYGCHFFTQKEKSLTEAIIDQIIPPDEWPGAKAAGVLNYIDKQLDGPFLRHQEKYRIGLAAISVLSLQMFTKPFEEVAWDNQTEFLVQMEAGKLSLISKSNNWQKGDDKSFFEMIRLHTMQGYYGSPRHGGNKNYVSYRMIGLDYPFIVGQNRYPM